MPFLSDAPGGRSTVSTVDVDEISVGSEMSDFEIVFFLRGRPLPCDGGVGAAPNPEFSGVLEPERGGVAVC